MKNELFVSFENWDLRVLRDAPGFLVVTRYGRAGWGRSDVCLSKIELFKRYIVSVYII